jgi:predicted ATPase/DNA-binding winged helix-turn-helix (wHTH) protein
VTEKAPSSEAFAFGSFRLIPRRRALLDGETPVRLGSRALDILIALVERAGEVVTKQDLMSRAWPDVFVEEANLKVHIGVLRRVLGNARSVGGSIVNVPGRGYSFVAPVKRLEDELASAPRNVASNKPHNIPYTATRVIGRDRVINDLAEQLQKRRLLTIVGAAGIGKTTVGLALAKRLAPAYRDGSFFVDLSSLQNPQTVPAAIASALAIQVRSQYSVAELVERLQNRQLMLVLDNCEHLIEPVAFFAEALVSKTVDVHLLATSREPLRVSGEWAYRLPPLDLPPPSSRPSPADALSFAGVELFTERAMASLDTFALTDANAPIVADICRRLDGIPLAIEFAAAQVDFLGVQGIADRLDDQLWFLNKGRRTAFSRHQTLRTTLDWSYRLLPSAEQSVLARLSVFRGSFTIASAIVMGGSSQVSASDVPEALANLVTKSLVTADASSETVHYRLLEITRVYALEMLSKTGEAQKMAARHADHCCAVLDKAEADWEKLSKTDWLARYATWIDDVRAALEWAFGPGADVVVGVSLTAASAPLWFALSLFTEYQEHASNALQKITDVSPPRPDLSIRINLSLGVAIFNTQGVVPEIATAYARALEIAESLGASAYQLRALWGLARERYVQGDYGAALAFCERFGQVAENSNDRTAELVHQRMMALALHLIGRQKDARPYAERALSHPAAAIRTAHKSFQEYDSGAAARSHLARILWLQGLADSATSVAEDGVVYGLSLEYPPPLCYVLVYAACPTAFWTGQADAAHRYVRLLLEQSADLSFGYWQSWRRCYEHVIALSGNEGTGEFRNHLLALRASATAPIYGDLLSTLREELAGSEAFARAEKGEAGWCAPEILRIKGIRMRKSGDPDALRAAEAVFLDSMDMARQQGALAWELRTATSLAQLFQEQGRIPEAQDVLGSVYANFREGFATQDLKAAKATLDGLA